MANPAPDNLFWDVLKWIAGVGGSLLVIGIGFVFWFLRDYALRFHEAIKIIFQRLKELDTERAQKWEHQNDFCRRCFGLLSRLQGMMNGKGKNMEGD